ncbi:hypothetical protein Pelo_15953 [Pelomyxa schiedti]|nr:hypothetical protein Pelo_15953 [Pelomyxa schiedti]
MADKKPKSTPTASGSPAKKKTPQQQPAKSAAQKQKQPGGKKTAPPTASAAAPPVANEQPGQTQQGRPDHSCNVTFWLYIPKDRWVNADQILSDRDFAQHRAELLSEIRNMAPSQIKGGFFITVNGQPWNGPNSISDIVLSLNWLVALADLVEPARANQIIQAMQDARQQQIEQRASGPIVVNDEIRARVWSQGDLRMSLKRVMLTMEDIGVGESGTRLPEVKVDVRAFISYFLRESNRCQKMLIALDRGLQQKEYQTPEVMSDIHQKLALTRTTLQQIYNSAAVLIERLQELWTRFDTEIWASIAEMEWQWEKERQRANRAAYGDDDDRRPSRGAYHPSQQGAQQSLMAPVPLRTAASVVASGGKSNTTSASSATATTTTASSPAPNPDKPKKKKAPKPTFNLSADASSFPSLGGGKSKKRS